MSHHAAASHATPPHVPAAAMSRPAPVGTGSPASADASHVSGLLRMMAPPRGAVIAHLGCSSDGVARLMHDERPDLGFVLVGRNRAQLRRGSAGDAFRVVMADMHQLPLPSRRVDGCMLLYSLCRSNMPAALAEAARITRPGGFLFLCDYERRGGDNVLMESMLAARAYSRQHLGEMLRYAGWGWPFAVHYPARDDAPFRAVVEDQARYDAIFCDLVPVVRRLTLQPLPMV